MELKYITPEEGKRIYILGLSGDKKGLRVTQNASRTGSWWHVHSDEMTPYQRRVHRKLVSMDPNYA